ncbi:hypothetical protein [Thermus thermamylovorans]|uniref:Uncharacterized protein n=1 Tax=Thermus thermamylovorans TaxID=2509362 RepID=A0A4Q9AXX6_9DEIN|nr:hypothetical protein [Thermus thermamylovorans]TBH16521.1 hypothetical protein ETP66_10355 [Thermus thermamylovorans]
MERQGHGFSALHGKEAPLLRTRCPAEEPLLPCEAHRERVGEGFTLLPLGSPLRPGIRGYAPPGPDPRAAGPWALEG